MKHERMASAHPRRSAETRRIGVDGVHLTRIRQGAHGLDDPATEDRQVWWYVRGGGGVTAGPRVRVGQARD